MRSTPTGTGAPGTSPASPPAQLLMLLVRFYQKLISPLLPSACRFHPSCSEYTHQALERFGFFKGLLLGLRRILRCHPFNPGGVDPVPGICPTDQRH